MALDDFGRFSEPALMILISLAEGEKHGYAMKEDISAFSGLSLGPGTLYGALARLEERGLIEAVPSEDRRKPYRLTSAGRAALRETLAGMQQFMNTGFQRLGGEA